MYPFRVNTSHLRVMRPSDMCNGVINTKTGLLKIGKRANSSS